MKNKVLVHIFIPVLEMDFEARIPVNKRINQVVYLIQKHIVSIIPEYKITDDRVLCDRRNGKIFDPNEIVIDSTIRNGTQLIIY